MDTVLTTKLTQRELLNEVPFTTQSTLNTHNTANVQLRN